LFDNLSYDECLPIIAEKISGRMKWVWGGDIDAEYDAVIAKTFGGGVDSNCVTSNGVISNGVH
jgi:salicylate hydroxylase